MFLFFAVLMTAVPLAAVTSVIQLTKLAQTTETWPEEAIRTTRTTASSGHRTPREFQMATQVTCTANESPTSEQALLWERIIVVMLVPCLGGGNTRYPRQTVYWVVTLLIMRICLMATPMLHPCSIGASPTCAGTNEKTVQHKSTGH